MLYSGVHALKELALTRARHSSAGVVIQPLFTTAECEHALLSQLAKTSSFSTPTANTTKNVHTSCSIANCVTSPRVLHADTAHRDR